MSKKGQQRPEYTHEQKAAIVERVCELYETQNVTLASCCEAVGITDRSFNFWVAQVSEFSERYKKAKTKQDIHYWQDIIKPLAKTSLQRILEGEEYEDTEIRDLSDKGILTGHTAQTIKRGKTPPNVTAVIFALKGEFPERFADRSQVNMQVENIEGEILTPAQLDEISAYLKAKNKGDETTALPGKSKG